MNRVLISGLSLGLAAGLLGPLTSAVGAQSGSHPSRDHYAWAYTDLRRAASAHWYAFDRGARVDHLFQLNVFRQDEVYAGAEVVEPSTVGHFINGRITLTHVKCYLATRPMRCTRVRVQADLGPRTGNTFTLVTADAGARLRATMPRRGSAPCTLIVDWAIPQDPHRTQRTTAPGSVETRSFPGVTGQGSCLNVTGLDAEGGGQLWSRDESHQTPSAPQIPALPVAIPTSTPTLPVPGDPR